MPEEVKNEEVSNIIEITSKDQFTEVVSWDKLTIVDFWAEWCGPCRLMIPLLHKVAWKHPELQLATVNVDANWEIAAEFEVNSIPAIFFMKNWEIVYNFVWAMPEDEVEKIIQNLNKPAEESEDK